VSLSGLGVAVAGFAGVFAMQRFGVRTKLWYVAPSLVAWAGIYVSGIHPTIAGVIIGLMTPVRAWLGPQGFITGVRREISQIEGPSPDALAPHELAIALSHVDVARREALSPAESLIETLHPWVAFGIMPVFALANAGVTISSGPLDPNASLVAMGVVAGLVAGKPIGILLASWLTLRSGLGTLPAGMSLRHIVVLGVVAGVGFTMSLFIAQLAFVDPELLSAAKLGVLAASGVAAIVGLGLGWLLLAPHATLGAATTADEAECSTEL
jgi:Na+:H+ antiporter, NhaA family